MRKRKSRVNTNGCVASMYSSQNKFWIGDPGTVVSYERWKAWGESTDWCGHGVALVKKTAIMCVDNTAFGNGVFAACFSEGKPMQSLLHIHAHNGMLGMVPAEFCEKPDRARGGNGKFIEVKKGTAMKMYSYNDFDLKPGNFLFEWTAPDGTNCSCTIDTTKDGTN